MKKMTIESVPMDKIDISESNVRKTDTMVGIDELAKNIEEIGLQQPVVVFKEGDRYKLIIGQRRYHACKKLGWKEIPALVTDKKDETEAAVISFSENIHRADLPYRDKMKVSVALLSKYGSAEAVAEILGVTLQTVRNYLGYTIVPERIKKMVDERRLSASTALRIARSIPNEELAVKIAERIVEEPRSADRTSIIDAASENPNENFEQILKIARSWKFRKITLNLTPRLAEALEQACREYGVDRKDIALEAMESWLKGRGFLK